MKSVTNERFIKANQSEQHCYETGIQYQNYFNWEYLDINPRTTLVGKVVVEFGGQCTSLIFGCWGFEKAIVVDPVVLKDKDLFRYQKLGIEYVTQQAEYYSIPQDVNEIWMSNCLCHVQDPELILDNIINSNADTLRIAEPLNTGTDASHPHSFTQEYFTNKLGVGKIYSGGSRVGYHEVDCYQGVINLEQLRGKCGILRSI